MDKNDFTSQDLKTAFEKFQAAIQKCEEHLAKHPGDKYVPELILSHRRRLHHIENAQAAINHLRLVDEV